MCKTDQNCKDFYRNGMFTFLSTVSMGLVFAGCTANDMDVLPDGFYEIAGYGYLLSVKDGMSPLIMETQSTCAILEGNILEGGKIFSAPEGSQVNYVLESDSESVTQFQLVAIDTPSRGCANGNISSPIDPSLSNLALLELLEERYPFFDLRGVDWPSTRARFEAEFASTTTQTELLNRYQALFDEIGDGHTHLDNQLVTSQREREFINRFKTQSSDPEFPSITEIENNSLDTLYSGDYYQLINAGFRFSQIVQSVTLMDRLESDNSDIGLRSGLIDTQTGYIRFDSFDVDQTKFLAVVDNVLETFIDIPYLIIDLRLNGGGSDHLVNLLAGRFTNDAYVAYSKSTMHLADMTRQEITVHPIENVPRYSGSVAILISPKTASAAENFIISILLRAGSTLLVGETTNGILSDGLPWMLPNGQQLTIGPEIYLAVDGISHEESGVSPDIEVITMDSVDEVSTQHIIEETLRALRSNI